MRFVALQKIYGATLMEQQTDLFSISKYNFSTPLTADMQNDLFATIDDVRFRSVNVDEFSNSADASRYIAKTSLNYIGNIFNRISTKAFVEEGDWESFPITIGNKVYHFLTQELRQHELFTRARDQIEIVECNGVAVLAFNKKNQSKHFFHAFHYIHLASLEEKLECVDKEGDLVANYTHCFSYTDPFDTYAFHDALMENGSGKYKVKVNGDKRNDLSLAPQMEILVDRYALSDAPFTISVRTNSFNDSVSLFLSYEQILGKAYIAFIEPRTIPKGFFVDSIVEPIKKAAPIKSSSLKTNASSYKSELQLLKVTTNRIELPIQVLSHYQKIKQQFTKAGGVYCRFGFDFSEGNAIETYEAVLTGQKVKSKKQEFAFFATGSKASTNVTNRVDIQPGKRIFEPSAGGGAIADKVREHGVEPIVNDLWDTNTQVLRDKGYEPHTMDFLQMTPADIGGEVDIIVGNPPWGNLVDQDHFLHALTFLKEGGEICMLISNTALTLTTKKAQAFQEFLKVSNAHIESVPSGSFEDTKVCGQLVHIKNYRA